MTGERMSRRRFVAASGAAGAGALVLPGMVAAAQPAAGAALGAAPAQRQAADALPHDAAVSLRRFRTTAQVVASGEFTKIYDPRIGESQPWYINDHTFIRAADGTWHLFGITHAEPADPSNEIHFAHATAPALHGPWTKRPFALTVDPGYGETHLWAPYVLRHGGTYYMFYAGGGNDPTTTEINLATSEDLYHWTRNPGGPLFRDGYEARDPTVLRVGGQWVMYYCATDDPAGGHHIVAYRTSTDLVHWGPRHVAYTSPDTGTGGGNTESPFVARYHDAYYLFIGPCGAYAGGSNSYICTDVFASTDPLNFTSDQHAGRIRAHAAEIVQDTDGRWYVSHAGWGQGGVFLAPLYWDQPQHRSGVQVQTASYQAVLLTSPAAELVSLRPVTGPGKGRNLVDTAFRGTTPYAGVGGYGDSARPGPARRVDVAGEEGQVALSDVQLGYQPLTVDWDLRFFPQWFDMSFRWHVTGRISAPVFEAGWSLDTTLPRLGDDGELNRPDGNVFGFARWTMATDDSVSLVAAYRDNSAWQEYNHWFDQEVGDIAWQSILSGVGYGWEPGSYAGGTWRIGISGKPDDTAYADQLYAALNGRARGWA